MKHGSPLTALVLVLGVAGPLYADPVSLWDIDAPLLASQIDDISSKNGAALDRYDNEFQACYNQYMVPLKKILAAVRNEKLTTNLTINDVIVIQWKEIDLTTKIMQIQDIATAKCDDEAFGRLKLGLWGPSISHSPSKPTDWEKIDDQDNAALKREHEERAACQRLYVGSKSTASKEILGGPQPKKAADAVFERQGQILDEALKQEEKCDIKADMRLQSQLWSPPSD